MLPLLCTTPNELASANAIRSILDGLAALVGPLAAAALLAEFNTGVSFGVVAVLAALAALTAAGLRYETAPLPAGQGTGRRLGVVREFVDGLQELRRRPRAAEVFGLGSAQCLVRGALTVLAVVLAVDLTDLGRPGVGVLWAAFGIGGLVAAMASIGAAGSSRLGTLFAVGIAMWGLPIVVSGLLVHDAVAVAAFTVVGAANALVDVAAYTLLQRLIPEQMLARVLALLEALFSLAVALGSLLIPLAISGLGDRGALVATGAILPVAVLARLAALRAIDADIQVRSDRIALLRKVGMLRLLPVPAIEGLALHLDRQHAVAGTEVFRAGDPGDGFYVIESGRVAVIEDDRDIRRLGPGDSFGEIALLRSIPRTATVRAVEDAELAKIDGARFVTAVTGFAATSSTAEGVVDGYLAADRQRHRREEHEGQVGPGT
jgi:hypothetical protein